MTSETKEIHPMIIYFCLLFVLAFPILMMVPLIGYLVQIGAIFSVLLFSYRRMHLMLIVGGIGSLALGWYVYGMSGLLFGSWAVVVLPGALLGRLMDRIGPPSKAFIYGTFFTVGLSLVLFFMMREAIFETIDGLKESLIVMLDTTSAEASMQARFTEEVAKLTTLMKRLMPSFMALSSVMQLFVGWIALTVVLKSLGHYSPTFRHFVYWKMPYYYFYIVGGLFVMRLLGTETMKVTADNGLLFIGFFYAVFGFSLMEYYLKKIRLSTLLKVLFYVGFLFLQIPGLILAALIGFFDSYFDFRKVKARVIG